MPFRDPLGDRMKQNYEYVTRHYLPRRVPVIIRLDGKAFHTFTKGMKKPFDEVLTKTMQDTMKYVCERVQGCVLGYTQSDEITLVLTDYATIKTDGWFSYNIQKMASVVASMATLAFNANFPKNVAEWLAPIVEAAGDDPAKQAECARLRHIYSTKENKALFDARVFSVPRDEVCNCLIWRQQDATRNSIEAVGQAHFSQKDLHGKNQSEIQEMLWQKRRINWNDFPTVNKRGACCIKYTVEEEIDDPMNPGTKITVTRRKWKVDTEIPIFTQDRKYIDKLL